jgi:hypothetical protein
MWVLVLCLLGGDLTQRVSNENPGVCWWACADSILGTDLKSESLLTGVGRDDGASKTDIDAVCAKYKLRSSRIDLAETQRRVSKGKCVIVTHSPWPPCKDLKNPAHAVVLLDIKYKTVRVNRRQSYTTPVSVVYYDPNVPDKTCVDSWSAFVSTFRFGDVFEP